MRAPIQHTNTIPYYYIIYLHPHQHTHTHTHIPQLTYKSELIKAESLNTTTTTTTSSGTSATTTTATASGGENPEVLKFINDLTQKYNREKSITVQNHSVECARYGNMIKFTLERVQQVRAYANGGVGMTASGVAINNHTAGSSGGGSRGSRGLDPRQYKQLITTVNQSLIYFNKGECSVVWCGVMCIDDDVNSFDDDQISFSTSLPLIDEENLKYED